MKALMTPAIELVVIGVLSAYVFLQTNYYIGLGTLAYLLMATGVRFIKQRNLHWRFMGAAMLLDLGLVLAIEFQRSAIATVLGFTLGPLQQMHIYTSTLAVLCYFPLTYMGIMKMKGTPKPGIHMNHRRLGVLTFTLRTLGFILMFSMIK